MDDQQPDCSFPSPALFSPPQEHISLGFLSSSKTFFFVLEGVVMLAARVCGEERLAPVLLLWSFRFKFCSVLGKLLAMVHFSEVAIAGALGCL